MLENTKNPIMPLSFKKILFSSLILGVFSPFNLYSDGSQKQREAIPQDILHAVQDSLGEQRWSYGGGSALQHTHSIIKFLNTKGAIPAIHTSWLINELEENPIIKRDFSSLPVITSHKILNRDLSLVLGPTQNPGHSLIHVLGVAQSAPAKISLGLLLSSPQTNTNLLKRRQDAIKEIIADDSQLLQDAYSIINGVTERQKELIAVINTRILNDWGNPSGGMGLSIFDLPVLNKIGHSLLGKTFQYCMELIGGKVGFSAELAFTACGLIYLAKQAGIPLPERVSGFHQETQNRIERTGGELISGSDRMTFNLLGLDPLMTFKGTQLFNMLITLYTMLQLKVLYIKAEWQYAVFLRNKYFISVVSKAAQALARIEEMYRTTAYCESLRKLTDLEPFYNFFEKELKNNSDLAKIFALARSAHMNLSYSPLKPAATLHFYDLIQKHKSIINGLLLSYGRLEVYLGCARLYKQQSQSTNQFCFAEYSDSKTPLYHAENLWNPLLTPEKAIGSNVNFGEKSGKRIYVLTGANEGGKSVFLKAVPLGALFAQTIGMVPATSCHIAPFEIIETYLNITDNVAQGHSLFRAEAVRARELLESVSTTQEKTSRRALIVFDEPFNGTSRTEATALAFAVTSYLEKQSNVCGVFATHFPLITTLEATCPAIENRCVTLRKDSEGTWKSTYKVLPGISEQHVALDILAREGVTGEIMENAQKVVQQITQTC